MSLSKINIQKTAEKLIGHFDQKAKVDIVDKDDLPIINIETELSAILIGRHGETLEALQYVLRLIIAKEAEEFVPLSLDISGYRALQDQSIMEQALSAAEKAKSFDTIESLRPMNGYERRLVHIALKNIDGITAESEGDEPYRRIVIRPGKSK